MYIYLCVCICVCVCVCVYNIYIYIEREREREKRRERGGFINIKDMYNNEDSQGEARVCEAHEVNKGWRGGAC